MHRALCATLFPRGAWTHAEQKVQSWSKANDCDMRLQILLYVGLLGTCWALLVSLADGYAWCSEYWNWDGKRIARDGCRWPAGDGVVITYINGIFHSVPEWENITNQLQAIFGHEVSRLITDNSSNSSSSTVLILIVFISVISDDMI